MGVRCGRLPPPLVLESEGMWNRLDGSCLHAFARVHVHEGSTSALRLRAPSPCSVPVLYFGDQRCSQLAASTHYHRASTVSRPTACPLQLQTGG